MFMFILHNTIREILIHQHARWWARRRGGDDDDGGGVGHPVVPVVAPQPSLLALLIALSPSSGHVLLPPATCHGNALQATRVPEPISAV